MDIRVGGNGANLGSLGGGSRNLEMWGIWECEFLNGGKFGKFGKFENAREELYDLRGIAQFAAILGNLENGEVGLRDTRNLGFKICAIHLAPWRGTLGADRIFL